MHRQAESGEAAHAAYKGGLDANQAKRLQAWTHALQSAWQSQQQQPQQQLSSLKDQPHMAIASRGTTESAAEELFRYAHNTNLETHLKLLVTRRDPHSGEVIHSQCAAETAQEAACQGLVLGWRWQPT